MPIAEAHPTRATYTGLFRDPNSVIEPLAPIWRTHWHAFVVQVLTTHTPAGTASSWPNTECDFGKHKPGQHEDR